jgi:hypothetical protein
MIVIKKQISFIIHKTNEEKKRRKEVFKNTTGIERRKNKWKNDYRMGN